MSRRRRSRSPASTFVATAVTLVIAALVWPERLSAPAHYLGQAHSPGLTQLVRELTKPRNAIYPDADFKGWALLALAALALFWLVLVLRALVRAFESSGRPITTLELSLDLVFEDDLMTKSTLCRVQKFHANNLQASAYYFRHSANSDDGVLYGKLDLYSVLDGRVITQRILGPVGRRKIEIIEQYHQPLPTRWAGRFLPVGVKRWLDRSGLLAGLIVTRRSGINHLNEFNGANPLMALGSLRHPVDNVAFSICFFEATAPNPADIFAFVMNENIVEDVEVVRDPDPPTGRVVYRAGVDRIQQENFQIQWSNGRLAEHIQQTQPLSPEERAKLRRLIAQPRVPPG